MRQILQVISAMVIVGVALFAILAAINADAARMAERQKAEIERQSFYTKIGPQPEWGLHSFTYQGNEYIIARHGEGVDICPALPPKPEKPWSLPDPSKPKPEKGSGIYNFEPYPLKPSDYPIIPAGD